MAEPLAFPLKQYRVLNRDWVVIRDRNDQRVASVYPPAGPLTEAGWQTANHRAEIIVAALTWAESLADMKREDVALTADAKGE